MRASNYRSRTQSLAPDSSNSSVRSQDSARRVKNANPFKIPEDQEFFSLRSKDRHDRIRRRNELSAKPIYKREPQVRSNLRHRLDVQEASEDAEEAALANIVFQQQKGKTKEDLNEFIQQKREIFLAQLAIDTKREELQRLERIEYEEEKALIAKETEINLFQEQFRNFLEADGKETMQARLNAEEKSKERIKVTMEIKQISSHISNLRNEIAHHDEKLQECQQYKNFIKILTPEEWKKEHTDGDLYFTDPNQLIDIIKSLEEQNMFLIRHCQEAEEAVERYKNNFSKLLDSRDESIEELNLLHDQELAILEASLEKNEQFKVAASAHKSPNVPNTELDDLINIVATFYKSLGYDSGSDNAQSMLTKLEDVMESLIVKIKDLDPYMVRKLAQEKEQQRREQARIENQRILKQIQNEKRAKTLEQAMQPVKKKTGRPLVPRHVPKIGRSREEEQERQKQLDQQEKEDQTLLFGDIWD